MKNKNLYLTVLLVVFFSAISFLAGKSYLGRGLNQAGTRGQFANQGRSIENGQKFPGNQMRGGGQILGEITSIESDKLTIKQMDGSSKIILISDQTSIVKTATGTNQDLKIGGKIAVFGKVATDAIISAQNIQIDPQNRMLATPSATPKK